MYLLTYMYEEARDDFYLPKVRQEHARGARMLLSSLLPARQPRRQQRIYPRMLTGGLGASHLCSRMSSPTPWLSEAAFHGQTAEVLAGEIDELRLTDLPLVKAFDRYNGADKFARHGAATQWVCQGDGCASLHGHTADTTVSQAATRARAPISARVAVAREPLRTAPQLRSSLARVDGATDRPFRDADVCAPGSSNQPPTCAGHAGRAAVPPCRRATVQPCSHAAEQPYSRAR
jgi:hypothetical protein